jgi:hypothetical protein
MLIESRTQRRDHETLRGDSFESQEKPTNIPTAGYSRLFIARLNYSSFVTVYPAPKFSGRRADVGVRVDGFATRDNVVLDIGDEEKQVARRTRSDRVLTEKV